jgi:hypothetical protein
VPWERIVHLWLVEMLLKIVRRTSIQESQRLNTMNSKTILLAAFLGLGTAAPTGTTAAASDDRRPSMEDRRSPMNQCHRRKYRHRHHHGYAYYPRYYRTWGYHYPRYYYPRRVVRVRWGPVHFEKYD